jgi:hypothetical protein
VPWWVVHSAVILWRYAVHPDHEGPLGRGQAARLSAELLVLNAQRRVRKRVRRRLYQLLVAVVAWKNRSISSAR